MHFPQRRSDDSIARDGPARQRQKSERDIRHEFRHPHPRCVSLMDRLAEKKRHCKIIRQTRCGLPGGRTSRWRHAAWRAWRNQGLRQRDRTPPGQAALPCMELQAAANDLKQSRSRCFRPKEPGTAHDATLDPIAADPGRCRAILWPAVRDGTGSRRLGASFPPDQESFSTSRKLPRDCGSIFEYRGADRIDRSRQARQVIAVSRRFTKWAWLQPTAVAARSPAWLDGDLASTERRALQARFQGFSSRRMLAVAAKMIFDQSVARSRLTSA